MNGTGSGNNPLNTVGNDAAEGYIPQYLPFDRVYSSMSITDSNGMYLLAHILCSSDNFDTKNIDVIKFISCWSSDGQYGIPIPVVDLHNVEI